MKIKVCCRECDKYVGVRDIYINSDGNISFHLECGHERIFRLGEVSGK